MRLAATVFAAVLTLSGVAQAQTITAARYTDPTERYAHGVLGDAIEHGTLELTLDTGKRLRIVLPESRVFEDTEPRLADLDGDGKPEVIVVESDQNLGARLSVYGTNGLIAATPHIGRSNRWLAPIGTADLDGDGYMEIAYVDRPHLAKLIRIWRFKDGDLELAGELPGYTNHRIGETDIAGGIRQCGNGPEMIVADGAWRNVFAITFQGGKFSTAVLGPHKDRGSFAGALACGN